MIATFQAWGKPTLMDGIIDIMGIQKGNAAIDGREYRGWLVGRFADVTQGLRHSEDVEIRWGQHMAGDERAEWMTGETRTAISILISGKIEIIFRDQTVELSKQGDYVMWGPGVDHKSRCLEDTVVLTVRWPSIDIG
jgi:hypothetical protein